MTFDDSKGRAHHLKHEDEHQLFKLMDDVMRSYAAIDGMASCVQDVRIPREVLERLGDAAGATNPGIVTAACLDACAAERAVAERAKRGFEELRKALAANARAGAQADAQAGATGAAGPISSGGAGDGPPSAGKPPASKRRRTDGAGAADG